MCDGARALLWTLVHSPCRCCHLFFSLSLSLALATKRGLATSAEGSASNLAYSGSPLCTAAPSRPSDRIGLGAALFVVVVVVE